MTTANHEHPQYATHADLEAMEGRIINRITELEVRLLRDFHGEFRSQFRWMVGLILPVYALVIGLGIALFNKLG